MIINAITLLVCGIFIHAIDVHVHNHVVISSFSDCRELFPPAREPSRIPTQSNAKEAEQQG